MGVRRGPGGFWVLAGNLRRVLGAGQGSIEVLGVSWEPGKVLRAVLDVSCESGTVVGAVLSVN